MQAAMRSAVAGEAGMSTRPFTSMRVERRALQVCNALSRTRKVETVETLKKQLDSSIIVFSMRFKGLSVATQQRFRKGLPESSRMMVCKNNLMRVAVKDSAKWSTLAEKGSAGENAWIFVQEDGIQDTLKHYFKFEEDLLAEAKKVAPKGTEVKPPTSLATILMDNALLSPAELKKCESLPTKMQLIATVAGLAKQPATKLAKSIKEVPSKLARAIKEVSKLDEDQSKLVSSFVKA